MNECGHDASDMAALLQNELAPDRRRHLVERVEACGSCAEQLRRLRRTWSDLPAATGHRASAEARERVLAYARDAVAAPESVTADLWRAALLGGLASMGGYLVLSLLHPIPSTVEFCRVSVLGDPAMTPGQICLVYAGVAALYAGVPVGVTAYLSSAGKDGWRVGLAEAAVFTLLALPVLVLQFGLQDAVITLTVLAGLASGAVAGGLVGAAAGQGRGRAGARV